MRSCWIGDKTRHSLPAFSGGITTEEKSGGQVCEATQQNFRKFAWRYRILQVFASKSVVPVSFSVQNENRVRDPTE